MVNAHEIAARFAKASRIAEKLREAAGGGRIYPEKLSEAQFRLAAICSGQRPPSEDTKVMIRQLLGLDSKAAS
jgi:hypothetical protein